MKVRSHNLIPLGIILSSVAIAFTFMDGGPDASSRSRCILPDVCTEYFPENHNVFVVKADQQRVVLTQISIGLTEEESAVITNPDKVLLQAKSMLIDRYGSTALEIPSGTPQCEDAGDYLNKYVTTVLTASDAWKKVSSRRGPIYIC